MRWPRRWQIAVLVVMVASGCGESNHLARTEDDLARIAAAKADPVFSLVPPKASVTFGPAVTYGGDKVEHDLSYKAHRYHVDEHTIEQTLVYEERSPVALRQVAEFYVEQLQRKGWVVVFLDCRPGRPVRLQGTKTIKRNPATLSVFADDDGRASIRVEVPIVGARSKPTTRIGLPPTSACLDFIFLERPSAVFEETRRSGAGLTIASLEGHVCPAIADRARRSALTDSERAFFENAEYVGVFSEKYDYGRGTADLVVTARRRRDEPAGYWRVSLIVNRTAWELCTVEGPLDHSSRRRRLDS